MTAMPAGDEAVVFTPDELTMLHRAVRQKLSRLRGDMARDLRRGDTFHAREKAASRHRYASLLILLDSLVPEDRR